MDKARKIRICSVCRKRIFYNKIKTGDRIYCDGKTGKVVRKRVPYSELSKYVTPHPILAWWKELLRMNGWTSHYRSVQNLLDHLRYRKAGSEGSREVFGFILAKFCKHCKATPDELVSHDRREVEQLVQQYTDLVRDRSRKRGSSVRYPNTILVYLKAFFTANGFCREDGRELRLKRYRQRARVTNVPEYIPTLAEAVRMGERVGCKRDRALVYLLFSTGLRNSTLRALTYGDVKDELSKEVENLCIRVYPEMKRRVEKACKDEIPYFVFTSKETTQAMLEMIQERIERYGRIQDDEPLFMSHYNQIPRLLRPKKFMTERELLTLIKKAAKNAGLKLWRNVHVHSMRKVFDRVLRSRLTDGGNLDPKDQIFFMGHIEKGTDEHYYDHTEVDEMRAKYRKLVFVQSNTTDASLAKFAKLLGVDFQKVLSEKKKELDRELRSEEEETLLAESIRSSLGDGKQYEQKLISEEEAQAFLDAGWEIQTVMRNGKVVVRRPKVKSNLDRECCRCANGHDVPCGDKFCPVCGAPVS